MQCIHLLKQLNSRYHLNRKIMRSFLAATYWMYQSFGIATFVMNVTTLFYYVRTSKKPIKLMPIIRLDHFTNETRPVFFIRARKSNQLVNNFLNKGFAMVKNFITRNYFGCTYRYKIRQLLDV